MTLQVEYIGSYKLHKSISFPEFFKQTCDGHKKDMLKDWHGYCSNIVAFYQKYNKDTNEDNLITLVGFYGTEREVKAAEQLLIDKTTPDYYVRIYEGWHYNIHNKELEKRLDETPYKYGDYAALPNNDKMEILNIIGRTIDNSSSKIGKVYEIIRERRNDESSRILELKDTGLDLGLDSMIP